MSWTQKPKSFYAQQVLKKLDTLKHTDPKMVKYYEDVVSSNGTVPALEAVERRKPTITIDITRTKACVKCHKEFSKPSHTTLADWQRRQYCTRLCRFNSNPHEAMPNLSKSN